MTIIDIINFYYSKYQFIFLKVEKAEGVEGKLNLFTKSEAADFLSDFEQSIAVKISFETHFTFNRKTVEKMMFPRLYIMYE